MFYTRLTLVFILLLTIQNSFARMIELKKGTRSIFIEEKDGWTLGKEMFGIPFWYFSPNSNGQRSNITFTDTGAELALDIGSLSSAQSSYQEDKKNWAKAVDAKVEKFLPYEVMINRHGNRVHKIGFSYTHEEKSYVERSFYIECRGKILFSKALRLKINRQHDKEFDEIITSLDCGGL
jgi:hypothetical protein